MERSYKYNNSEVIIRIGDILDSDAEVLVSSDDSLVTMGGGVSASIRRKEGTGAIENDVRKRDYIDSHRDFAPLKCAPDALTLDTSFMSVEEVVNKVIEIINAKLEEKGING